jgi:hypothetical protein
LNERWAKAEWWDGTRVLWQVKEEWLHRGGWDKWETEKTRGPQQEEDLTEGIWVKLSL